MQDAAYVDRLQRHLAIYRERELGVPAGVWGDPPREYGHILRRRDRNLNIVEPLRAEFWRAQTARSWKLHRFFHHLTSSQALAFNLFFPFYPHLPPWAVATRRLLGIREGAAAALDFERELPGGDGTNIDVMIEEADQRRTVIEVKLTEAAFGRAPHDDRHLKKLAETYPTLLRGRLGIGPLDPRPFLRDYQLHRQLAQLRPDTADRVVLLLPRARDRLWEFASAWCVRPELSAFRGAISLLAIEDLLVAMQADALRKDGDLRPFEAAALKYLPPAG